MKPQTAVEWLQEAISKKVNNELGPYFIDLFDNAKAMEKEQHQETFKQSRQAKIFEKNMPPVWESWEQYYNETFNKTI